MVVSFAVGEHSQRSLEANKTVLVQSEEVNNPDDISITMQHVDVPVDGLSPSSAVPVEDLRQGSFTMDNQMKESSTTMPSSALETINPEYIEHGNGSRSGRDSPPTQKVQFSEDAALYH